MTMERFFDAEPRVDHKERATQMEISVDYRMVHDAMGAGHDDDRAYLSTKYGRELSTVAQLWQLGQELFAKMDTKSRADDLRDVERRLTLAAETAEEGPDHA
jgi:hypothetical protein